MTDITNETTQKPTLVPKMTESEIVLLKSILNESKEYFEWGLGGSTIIAYNCGVKLIQGVDSSKEWIEKVKNNVEDKSRLNLMYINIGPTTHFGYPKYKLSILFWSSYSKAIWCLAKSPDVILIDGRFRVACAIQAVLFCVKNNLKPKILLHDIHREDYKIVYTILNPITKIPPTPKADKGLQVFEIKENNNIQELNNLYKIYKYNTI